MRAVMPLDFSNGGDAVVATLDIKDIPGLKGQKVAFAPLSPSDFLLAFALRKHGLKDSDVLPVGDYGLRAGVQKHYGLAELPGKAELTQIGTAWEPYRSIGTWYIWRGFGAVPQSE